MKIDFRQYTKDDLRQLIMDANLAMSEYDNRAKTKVYTIFIPFKGWEYFLKKENAFYKLNELIEDDIHIFSDDEFKTKCQYLTDSELEYCSDYKQ